MIDFFSLAIGFVIGFISYFFLFSRSRRPFITLFRRGRGRGRRW